MSHLDQLLSVYLDGETTRPESIRVETHLSDCLECRRRLRDLNQARSALRSLPMLELPAGLVPFEKAPPRSARPVWIGAAAAAVAAVIAVATLNPGPEPIDLSDISRQIGARASLDTGVSPLRVVVPGGQE